MEQIVAFANAWGSRRGGINAFNADLCLGLRNVASPDVQVVCVLVGPAVDDADSIRLWSQEMCAAGIRLETMRTATDLHSPTADDIRDLRSRHIAGALYIGHDLFTGGWATKVGKALKRPSVVVHHMAPGYYQPLKASSKKAAQGDRAQRQVFEQPDYVAAVGSRLLGHANAKFSRTPGPKVFELIPGLAHIKPVVRAPRTFGGITIGRFAADDDIIKQSRLAACGFGRALGNLASLLDGLDLNFIAYGLSAEEASYKREYEALAAEIARGSGHRVAVQGHPFNEDRDEVFAALRASDVFYMLSLHEGFGLSGLEAIAAGVPLILSKRSGLHDFLADHQLLDYVFSVSLQGAEPSLHQSGHIQSDIDQVAAKTCEVFRDKQQNLAKARELREKLVAMDITWERCAAQLLTQSGCAHLLRAECPPMVVENSGDRRAWPWTGLREGEESTMRSILAWLMDCKQPFARLEGPADSRKRRVLARLADLVHWELRELYRTRVETIETLPSSAALERLVEIFARSTESTEDDTAENLLLIVDPPVADPADAPFWSELVKRGLESRVRILLTASELAPPLPQRRTIVISWRSRAGLDSAPTSAAPLLDAEVQQLLGNCVFGLTANQLFEALDGDVEQRYALLNRLNSEQVAGVVRVEERWQIAGGLPRSPDTGIAKRLVTVLSDALGKAAAATERRDWALLRTVLPSALECIAQIAQAGHAEAAFDQFSGKLFSETLYRFARFDMVVEVLKVFFLDFDFRRDSVLPARSASLARAHAAQALTNLGSIEYALATCDQVETRRLSSRDATRAEIHASMTRYLAGDYEGATALLLPITVARGRHGAVAHRSLAKIAIRRLRLDEAASHLGFARKLYLQEDDLQGLLGVDAYQAEMAVASGRGAVAIDAAERGLASLERLEPDPSMRSDARDRVRLLVAHAKALQLKSEDHAVVAADAALAAALRTGAFDFVAEAYALVARLVPREVAKRIAVLERLTSQAGKLGLRRHHGELLLALVEVNAVLGKEVEAVEFARSAQRVARKIGDALLWRMATSTRRRLEPAR